MSHSQFHCTGRVYLDLHGLIFETSICYWQDQPGSPEAQAAAGNARQTALCLGRRPAPSTPRSRDAQRGAKLEGSAFARARRVRGCVFTGGHAATLRQSPAGIGDGDRAASSVAGLLGQTVRLGLASIGRPGKDAGITDNTLRHGPSRA